MELSCACAERDAEQHRLPLRCALDSPLPSCAQAARLIPLLQTLLAAGVGLPVVQVLDARAGDDWIVSDLKDQLFYRQGLLPPATRWKGASRSCQNAVAVPCCCSSPFSCNLVIGCC